MNRNTFSRFDLAPQVDIQRSRFDRSHSVKTSFNVGELIPFYVDEVLPGDTFKVKTSKVARLQTLITPIYDNLFLDTYYFFVPNRLVWEHWQNFMGENTASAWIPSTEYNVPMISAPSGGWNVGTIADYFGIPTGIQNNENPLKVSALPFRAYSLICNEWFRDENLTSPLSIPVNDSEVTGSNGASFITDVAKGGKPFKVAKYHDYFTSCLPSPQKGPDVSIPVTNDHTLPVFTQSMENSYYSGKSNYGDEFPLWFQYYNHTNLGWAGATVVSNFKNATEYNQGLQLGYSDATDPQGIFFRRLNNEPLRDTYTPLPGDDPVGGEYFTNDMINDEASSFWGASPVNLVAEFNPVFSTINDLRRAFQIQRLYEKDARGGTRYIEILKSHFGVTSPDARLQRPEYLGGNRIPLNVRQVIQTSGTDVESNSSTPLGDVAGMSVTTDVNYDFEKSFVEHGFVIGLCCARYKHTYQQGINRMFSRKTRFDYYWPVLANLGEQGVKNKEIYVQAKDEDDEIFGYQEAWAEYRYMPNIITGEMRSSYAQSLDMWHFGDDYESLPTLSDSWIREDKSNVDRCLQVTSSTSNQIFADIFVENKCVRPMPLYSIPGLIDHH